MSESEYTRWDDVPAHLKTKTQLGKLGKRPAKDQKPAAYFHSSYYTNTYDLYDLNKAIDKRKPSKKQLAALAKAREAAAAAEIKRRTCPECGGVYAHYIDMMCDHCTSEFEMEQSRLRAIKCAADIVNSGNYVVIDTETTDLPPEPEIISIAIISHDGQTLLNQNVKPKKPITAEATAVHGLTAADLSHCPTWLEIWPQVAELLRDKLILSYNSHFDHTALIYTCKQWEIGSHNELRWMWEVPEIDEPGWECIMILSEMILKADHWPSLAHMAHIYNIEMRDHHNAESDAQVAHQLLQLFAIDPISPT